MSLSFPARFMLVAAMNPCPCGYFNDRTRECHCTPMIIQRYISKISGPLLDRIDIHIDVPAVNYRELRSTVVPESSADIRARIQRAREISTRPLCPWEPSASMQMRKWAPVKSVNTVIWARNLSTSWSEPSRSRGSGPALTIESFPDHLRSGGSGVDRARAYS